MDQLLINNVGRGDPHDSKKISISRVHTRKKELLVSSTCAQQDPEPLQSASIEVIKPNADPSQNLFCIKCNASFTSSPAMQSHLKKVHNFSNPNRFDCCFCSEIFNLKKDYHEHLKKEHGQTTSGTRRFQLCACTDCGRMFYNNGALGIHRRAVHSQENTYQCDPCGKVFPSKKYMREHIKRIHINQGRVRKQREPRPPAKPDSEKPFKCNLCGTGFESDRQVSGHRVNCAFFVLKPEEAKLTGELTATTPDKESFVIMPKLKKKKKEDKIGTVRQSKLGKINGDEPPFACPQCGKLYNKKSSLYMHLSTKHGKRSEPTVCEACGKHVINIRNHMRQVHLYPEVRPHMCDLCGARFKKSSALLQHRPIHTGERHICPVCGRGFTQRGAMKKHVSTLHHLVLPNKSDEPPTQLYGGEEGNRHANSLTELTSISHLNIMRE
ncbi:hypothetical protein M8J75_010590 [Diaphorina citri]|nr:hypothetical protein M8J75_010590 [Diaphorina citri]